MRIYKKAVSMGGFFVVDVESPIHIRAYFEWGPVHVYTGEQNVVLEAGQFKRVVSVS